MAATLTHIATPITTTAGTFTALSSSQIFASTVVIQAGTGNTNYVYVGSSNVTGTNGIALGTAIAMTLTFDTVFGVNGKIDLSKIFLASDTTGNQVKCFYAAWSGG